MARRATLFLLTGLVLWAGLTGLFSPGAARAGTPVLPRPVSAQETARLLAHPPSGLEVVDIRPSDEYADYALPGSLNLDPAAVLADETLLAGSGPLLFVDKDGTLAFAVAGRIAAKTSRPVMALEGGLAAWWKSQEMDRAIKFVPVAPVDNPVPQKTEN